MGILKFAYRLGDLAVVGGGWGAGVHNTLEPAVFGLPLGCRTQSRGVQRNSSTPQCQGTPSVRRREPTGLSGLRMDERVRSQSAAQRKPVRSKMGGKQPRCRGPNRSRSHFARQLTSPPRLKKGLQSEAPSNLSEKRDSNSRPQPWQGCALPTELFSLGSANLHQINFHPTPQETNPREKRHMSSALL